jgi:hypothetical protein
MAKSSFSSPSSSSLVLAIRDKYANRMVNLLYERAAVVLAGGVKGTHGLMFCFLYEKTDHEFLRHIDQEIDRDGMMMYGC